MAKTPEPRSEPRSRTLSRPRHSSKGARSNKNSKQFSRGVSFTPSTAGNVGVSNIFIFFCSCVGDSSRELYRHCLD